MIKFLVPVFAFLIYGVPFVAAGLPPLAATSFAIRAATLVVAPVTFTLGFLLVSGALSLPFQKAIIAGKFPRDLRHPVYGPRRLHGLCWTAVYYCTPVYSIFLTIPTLRKTMFRLFGYKGPLAFTVYPDTWIRDLPLLSIGDGAYLANKSTIGSNICLSDGSILVDGIRLDSGAMVGHLGVIGPGTLMGEKAEVGVCAAMGIRVKLGKSCKIAPTCAINHGVSIGDGAEVGTMSFIGTRAIIGDGIKLPGGSNIPAGAVIKSQQDLDQYISSETVALQQSRERATSIFEARLKSVSTEKGKPATLGKAEVV